MDQLSSQEKPNPWFNPRFQSLYVDGKVIFPGSFGAALSRGFVGYFGPQYTIAVNSGGYTTCSASSNLVQGVSGLTGSAAGLAVASVPSSNIFKVTACISGNNSAASGLTTMGVLRNGTLDVNCAPCLLSTTTNQNVQLTVTYYTTAVVSDAFTIGIASSASSNFQVNSWTLTVEELPTFSVPI